jgi:two-component system, NtrC family, response regulator AtoC
MSDGYDPTTRGHDDELASDAKAPAVTRVLVLWESGSATYFLKPYEQVKLGRHSDCEIVIDLPSVSRRHARLTGAAAASGELATVEDIGGLDGVRVRGQKIPLNVPTAVLAGDVIELGGAIVVLYPPRDRVGAPSAGAIARAAAHRAATEDPMKAVERLIDVVAQSDLCVLLLGETGTGKSHAAEAIHSRSPRARGPLLQLNCASLPEPLLEGELFGYEKEAKPGLLESAAGGTLLLDEVGEMPLALQAKLLTAIEKREVMRLTTTTPPTPTPTTRTPTTRPTTPTTATATATADIRRPIDVRLLAATNRDLLARSIEGTFRLDLYYRLNGISIVIPPLRERTGEIPRFAAKFLAEAAAKLGKATPRLSNEALGVLVHHPFLGNIRELRNTMDRACVLARGSFIGPEHLMFENAPGTPGMPISTPNLIPSSSSSSSSSSSAASLKPTARFAPPPIAPTEPPDAPTDAPPPIVMPTTPIMPKIPRLPRSRKR